MKNNMMKSVRWMSLVGLLAASGTKANDSFNAELSHFAGNTALASATTVVTYKYFPENKKPAMTGFIVSASEALIGECADRATGGKLSLLDVAVGTVGAAVGAYATDKWYIAPKVNTQKGETTVGVVAIRRF